MKSRRWIFLIAGFVLGLVTGLALLGSSRALFGTAGLNATADPAYFLADMDATRNWLVELYPEEEQPLTTAFANLVPLTDPMANFREVIRAAQPDIDYLVNRAFIGLTGTLPEPIPTSVPTLTADRLPAPLLRSLADGDVTTCLGIDENPYNIEGYILYLYTELPVTQIDSLPATWERLDEPKSNDLYWQRLACQSLTVGTPPQRR
jgi:hypothetical protein